MLTRLRIQNLATILSLDIVLGGGLHVITGETGAGKSIVIDALQLVLGGRAHGELVRTGFDECVVEATFEPSDPGGVNDRLGSLGLAACEDGQLLVRRTVHREGRSRAWINGSQVRITDLGLLMRGLVDVSGQHQHTTLLDPALHIDLLDQVTGMLPRRMQYAEAHGALLESHRQLRSLRQAARERDRRLDYLRFQLEEIDKAAPVVGEDEALRQERQRLASAGRLREAASEAESWVYSGDAAAVEQAGRAADRLSKVAALDPALAALSDRLREGAVLLEDTARELGRYVRTVADDPSRLDEIDERLEGLKRLCRRHGGDIATVLQRRDDMRAELQRLESIEQSMAELEGVESLRRRAALDAALVLRRERIEAARGLSQSVAVRLTELGMPRGQFEIRVGLAPAASSSEADTNESSPSRDDGTEGVDTEGGRLTPSGMDVVEFLFSANPGEELRPLSRIGSGGELARVMLALKRVLAQRDPVDTYVFDEVDVGIGGATAEVVGRLIREVGADRQVLCITHLAQVAAWAHHHWVVEKQVRDDRTFSVLTLLRTPLALQTEIARMLSGHHTAASLAHAAELLASHGVSGTDAHSADTLDVDPPRIPRSDSPPDRVRSRRRGPAAA